MRKNAATTGTSAVGSSHAAFAEILTTGPLFAQTSAAMAMATTIGVSIAGQFAGAFFGVVQGALEAHNKLGRPGLQETEVAVPKAAVAPALREIVVKPAIKKKAAVSRSSAKAGASNAAAKAKPGVAKAATRRSAKSVAKDDLKRIAGIGRRLEKELNEQGITQFRQIAAWDAAEVTRLNQALGLDGCIGRDDWVGQARKLVG